MTSPKQILIENKILPKKSFGQNFMMDENINKKIASLIPIFNGASVIEIGVGTGSLTKELLKHVPLVYGIEKDRDLIPIIQEQFKKEINDKSFILFEENAAKFDLNKVASESNPGAIIANLPYHLTSSFILMVIENFSILSGAVFLIQKEVADRLCSKENDKNYSFLTVVLQLIYTTEKSFFVPKTCFWPVPKVDSAVITLRKRKEIIIKQSELLLFINFVKTVFQQRRKKLSSILKSLSSVDMSKATTDLNLRPENLSPAQFYKLFKEIHLFEG